MNTIERLKAIKEHFENISIEEFENNLIKAGMNEDKKPLYKHDCDDCIFIKSALRLDRMVEW